MFCCLDGTYCTIMCPWYILVAVYYCCCYKLVRAPDEFALFYDWEKLELLTRCCYGCICYY